MARLTTRVKDTALAAWYMKTDIITKESGKMEKKMAMAVIISQMVLNELALRYKAASYTDMEQ